MIRRWSYPLADLVCVQTRDIAAWFKRHMNLNSVVIPNPVQVPSRALRTSKPRQLKRVIALGRLAPQKGYDRLIDAFALISDRVPDWELIIFGEGGERERLQQQIEFHQLEAKITLAGTTTATHDELVNSDLFVHTARYEGFPNAVLEALAAGLCVAATDCPGATREILDNGKFGVLLPDGGPEEIGDALLNVMTDEQIRQRYAENSLNAITSLSPPNIASNWLSQAAQVRQRRQSKRR